jgi:hypothetical protein
MFKKIPLVIDFNLGVGYINTNYRSIITATTDGLDVGRKDNQNFNGMDLYLGTSIGFDLSKIKLIE